MKRKVTAEERRILLDNPELVMFSPKNISYGLAWIKLLTPSFIVMALWVLIILFFPDLTNSHPVLFPVLGVISILAAAASVPVYWYLGLDTKRNTKIHYLKDLKKALPKDLMCNIATVNWVVYQKAECGLLIDGKEEYSGYFGCVNCFKLVPKTKVAIVYGKDFFAFIKKDPRTESFYGPAAQ